MLANNSGKMTFTTTKSDKYASVKVNLEKLDGTKSPELKTEFVQLSNDGVKNIILDLSLVKYSDSSGLSAILVANRLCKNASGTFVLCAVQPSVMKLITISQLDSILSITNTFSEAEDLVFMDEISNNL